MQNCHILHFMPFVAGTWSSVEFHFVMCMLMFFRMFRCFVLIKFLFREFVHGDVLCWMGHGRVDTWLARLDL